MLAQFEMQLLSQRIARTHCAISSDEENVANEPRNGQAEHTRATKLGFHGLTGWLA